MINRPCYRRVSLLLLVTLLVLVVLPAVAAACPTCKDTLAANDPARQNLVRGYFYSILFMLSMPFLILGGLSGYFYYEVRKARRQRVANASAASGPLVPVMAAAAGRADRALT